MDFNQIKEYWEERASADSSAQSTTQDYYLREIEFRVLKDLIDRYRPENVMDVGCGDARTTARLAAEFEEVKFIGADYSESMVRNAQDNITCAGINNLRVTLCDISRPLPFVQQKMIYSTRCLINLPTWELQQTAIRNVADALSVGGYYVMIENFVEGHENFNQVRCDFGLPKIPVREHNLFFKQASLLDYISNYFEVLQEVNISSTYYLVSRAIYSKICQDDGTDPDYFDAHHKYAAQLPFSGEFGPVRMICMARK
jgi:ubiquinone/menaquinone biosynthesis C-methylase UbiE